MYDSFDNFIAATVGTTVGQGECWDYINLLWNHLGGVYYTYPPSDPSATNHGVKWGWLDADARAANTITHLTQISSLSEIKKGDMVVTSGGTYGHAGFAASDYDGSGYLPCYSQNFNGVRSVTLDNNDMATFEGAWRYDEWQTPTPPSPTTAKSNFKWVLYARKLRDKRSGL